MNMSLLALPNELLHLIAKALPRRQDLNAFTRTNRHLYHLLNPYLYHRNAEGGEYSALIWSAEGPNREATARIALKYGADVNAADCEGPIPFEGLSALLLATANGYPAVVEVLLAHPDVNVNESYEGEVEDPWNDFEDYYCYQTPLVNAVSEGHADIVRQLLAHPDINVNATDEGTGQIKRNALMYAAASGRKDIVELLLAHPDIDVNAKENHHDRTALLWAVTRGNGGVARLLLAYPGIDVNATDGPSGRTALLLALQRRNEGVFKQLLTHPDVDPNVKWGEDEASVLMWAADHNQIEAVKMLVARKDTDINHQNRNGHSALMLAAAWERREVAEVLLAREDLNVNARFEFEGRSIPSPGFGINIPESTRFGRTALQIAVGYGDEAMVKLLLARPDVNINLRDMNGLTALDIAREKNRKGAVEMLIARDTAHREAAGQ